MSCDRFRITADGKLRNCLSASKKPTSRTCCGTAGDAAIAQAIRDSIAAKKEGHEINTARFIQPDRPMYSIGGKQAFSASAIEGIWDLNWDFGFTNDAKHPLSNPKSEIPIRIAVARRRSPQNFKLNERQHG